MSVLSIVGSKMRRWGQRLQHMDRAGRAEIYKEYGKQTVAPRGQESMIDILARNIDSNVYICIRALSDAICSLPVEIRGAEVADGRETDFIDPDHEANQLIRHPNTDMTLREVIRHNVMSFLGDGNAYCTVERQTGPNAAIELWPRDPRNIEVQLRNMRPTAYRVDGLPDGALLYKPGRMLHIRDLDVSQPLYGRPRHEAIRKEIELNYNIKVFNAKFFEHGAALNLMFTPDKNMSEEQHEMLLEQLAEEVQGVDNAFGLFVNRYAGTLESPNQTHKDIAFLELLKFIRETTFGAFGLPPFRGGVMEYANYANALAQDKDFWNNTVKPITTTLGDAWNKQIVWPTFGEEVSMSFSFAEVPALQGDPKEVAQVHHIYVHDGVMSVNEVREELGKQPLDDEAANTPTRTMKTKPADDSQPKGDDPEESDKDKDDKSAKTTKKEENELTRPLHAAIRQLRHSAVASMRQHTSNGLCMFMLMNPDKEALICLPHAESGRVLQDAALPVLKGVIRERCFTLHHSAGLSGPFNAEGADVDVIMGNFVRDIAETVSEVRGLVKSILHDADKYSWTIEHLVKALGGVFNYDRARTIAMSLLSAAIRHSESIITVHSLRAQDTERKETDDARAKAG